MVQQSVELFAQHRIDGGNVAIKRRAQGPTIRAEMGELCWSKPHDDGLSVVGDEKFRKRARRRAGGCTEKAAGQHLDAQRVCAGGITRWR